MIEQGSFSSNFCFERAFFNNNRYEWVHDTMSMLNSPLEVLETIISFLSPKDLKSIALTCKLLNKISLSDRVWLRICWNYYRLRIPRGQARLFCQRGKFNYLNWSFQLISPVHLISVLIVWLYSLVWLWPLTWFVEGTRGLLRGSS